MAKLLFTPSALLRILLSLPQLEDCEIQLYEALDNSVQLIIDNEVYELLPAEDSLVLETTQAVLDSIEESEVSEYEALEDEDIVVSAETIEAGVLKSIVKSLLLGGCIRLSHKLLS